jgi:hypothetical protein
MISRQRGSLLGARCIACFRGESLGSAVRLIWLTLRSIPVEHLAANGESMVRMTLIAATLSDHWL